MSCGCDPAKFILLGILLHALLSAPTGIQVSNVSTNSATVCWQQSDSAQRGEEEPRTEFGIRLSKENQQEEEELVHRSRGEALCHDLDDLESGVTYSVTLVSYQAGSTFAHESEPYDFTTKTNPCNVRDVCTNGVCSSADNELGYSCQCSLGYYGPDCEQFNACSRSPCGDYPCDNQTHSQFYCVCPDERRVRDPNDCLISDPCLPNPCHNNARCSVARTEAGEEGFSCECRTGFWGARCERKNPCRSVNCHNGGVCVNQTDSEYNCMCLPGFQGANCEIEEPCHSISCLNGGRCELVGDLRRASCICPPGFTGEQCESVDGCHQSPCLNGATCTPLPMGEYSCQCVDDTTYGKNCHNVDVCKKENPCRNGGTCKTMGADYTCVCPLGYKGSQCTVKDACLLQQPCQNGASCVSLGDGEYRCECVSRANWGQDCQFTDLCASQPCANGGACLNSSSLDTGDSFSCQCIGNFDGLLCQRVNNCKDPNYCNSHGQCSDNKCDCEPGYYGPFCENYNVCEKESPCQHGGKCESVGHNKFTCHCLTGYHGDTCQRFDPCHASPCHHNQLCVVTDDLRGEYECQCTGAFYGSRCERVNPCLQLNGGCPAQLTCHNTSTSHVLCTSPTPPAAAAVPSCTRDQDCFNGGRCEAAAGTCRCVGHFAGARCDHIQPCNNPLTCSNNGHCRQIAPDNAECVCRPGYYGAKCELHDPCGLHECANGGNCVIVSMPKSGGPQPKCHCPEGFGGPNCREQAKACVSDQCGGNGKCLHVGWDDNSELYKCVCHKAFEGRNCEIKRVCGKGTNNFGGKLYVWPETAIGQEARVFCQLGSLATTDVEKVSVAVRACHLAASERETYPQWQTPKYDNCIKESSAELANQVLDAMLASPSETAEMVQYIATVLPHLLPWTSLDQTLAEKHVRLVNRLVQFPPRSLQLAQQTASSASGIVESLSDLLAKFDLDTMGDRSFNLNMSDVQIHVSETLPKTVPSSGLLFHIDRTNISIPREAFGEDSAGRQRVQITRFSSHELFIATPADQSLDGLPAPAQVPATYQPASPVISVELGRLTDVKFTAEKLSISFHVDSNKSFVPTCVFWKTDERVWNTKGVAANKSFTRGDDSITCFSSHLSAFAYLMTESAYEWGAPQPSVLPFVGAGLAVIAYTLTIITYCLFGSLRRESLGNVVINLGASLLLLNISFIVAALHTRFEHSGICSYVAVAIHFFLLSSLAWFTVDALFMYSLLSRGSLHYINSIFSKFLLAAWGTPLFIIAPTLLVNGGTYTVSDLYCRISPQLDLTYYAGLVTPCAVIVLTAVLLHLMSLRLVACSAATNSYSAGSSPDAASHSHITSMTFIILIFAGTWVLCQLVELQLFDFLFCLLNVAQSWLLFSGRCILLREARDAWRVFFSPTSDLKPAGAIGSRDHSNINSLKHIGYEMDGSNHSLLRDCVNSPVKDKLLMTHASTAAAQSPTRNTVSSNGSSPRNPPPVAVAYSCNGTLENGGSGAVTFGETVEIKKVLTFRDNNNDSFRAGSPPRQNGGVAAAASQRLERGDAYSSSYLNFKDDPDPNRESYV